MSERTELIDKVEEKTGWHVNRRRFKIVTDTSQWMEINKGDVIRIEDYEFAIRGNMREPRFGIDDQPKYWVFHAIDLGTGEQKILKTVYHEEFYAHIGILKVRCYRSQSKESQVLDITRGDRRFMQGFTCYDEKGNNVRILDYINGKSFFHFIPDIEKSHEEYFHEDLPRILWKLTDSILAVQFLHVSGMCHGDIRNDHIIIESGTKDYRWIDFDLKQDVRDFDLWSIGNILSYTVGKGIRTFAAALKSSVFDDRIKKSLAHEDASAFYEYRIMNLQKLFPYIPENLGRLLRHFTIKPIGFYSDIKEFIADYQEMLETDFPRSSIKKNDN